MKKVESSLDYGDIEAWREWAEAEYCQWCGGSGWEVSGLMTEEVVEPMLSSAVFTWRECEACNGTGRP